MLRSGISMALLLGGTSLASAQGMVSGRIFDDPTSCPLRAAVINVVGSPARTMTDAQGRSPLGGFPATAFTLQVALNGYVTATTENVIATDTATRVDFSLERATADAGTKPQVR